MMPDASRNNGRSSRKFAAIVLLLAAFAAGVSISAAQEALDLTGSVAGTHDPSIAKDGQTWYVFATGKAPGGGQLAVRCSEDLHQWRACGQVFDAIPQWIREASPGTKDLWAPDIRYAHGEYRLYYAYSLFGSNISGIALATNKTLDSARPDYRWVDQGLVLQSKASDNFNAIDPNYIATPDGRAWLAFGSFWSGIQLVHLDPATGKPLTTPPHVVTIATRRQPADAPAAKPGLPPDWQAVEAPFVVHHGGYYYLFVSWDLCCRGTHSTYRTMVGRSRQITGPYVDRQHVPLTEGGGAPVLEANRRWLGPGGASAWSGPGYKDGVLVYHAYDAASGKPSLQISTIAWRHGWPVVALAQH